MENKYSISVIVPVYNERNLVVSSTDTINAFLKENFKKYEILVIESGSTDGSYELCDEVAKQNSSIKIIHEGSKNGFGSAVSLGYQNASMDLVWLITLDMPFPLDAVLNAIPYLEQNDYILSYRINDSRAFSRRIQSFVYNLILKIFLRLRVRHVNSGFKLYKRNVVADLRIMSKGWFVDAETLYLLKMKKKRYVQIPVELIDRSEGNSSVGAFAFVSVLKEMIAFLRSRKKV